MDRETLYIRDNLEEIDRNYSEEATQQKKSDLAFICMCLKDGIEVMDRKYLIKNIPACFVGSEAIDWMLNHTNFTGCKTRKDGEELGERLLQEKFISCPIGSHSFQDKQMFFRFKVNIRKFKIIIKLKQKNNK